MNLNFCCFFISFFFLFPFFLFFHRGRDIDQKMDGLTTQLYFHTLFDFTHPLHSDSDSLCLQIPCTRLSAVSSSVLSTFSPSTWNDLASPSSQKETLSGLDSFNFNLKTSSCFFQNDRLAMLSLIMLLVSSDISP